MKQGDKVQLFSKDHADAVIDQMDRIESDTVRGWLVSFKADEYGDTQPFWYPDSGVLQSETDLRLHQSGMPIEYVYKRLADFNWNLYRENTDPQQRIAKAFVENYAEFDKQGRGLYIFSDTKGSGKTFLSCVLANEILQRRDLSVKFVNAADFVELVKRKDDQARDMIRSYYECSLLILDDIGIEGRYDWIQTAVFRLVDRRYTDHLPTIYTSNLEIENLPCDDRITSRIDGVSVPLAIPCQSIRAELAKQDTAEFLQSVLG